MEKKESEQWKKTIEDAIDFAEMQAWFLDVDYSVGKMEDDFLAGLSESELTEFNRLKEILGEPAIAYLVSKNSTSIPPAGGKNAMREAEDREKEYERIKALTPEQFREEVEKEVEIWKEDFLGK